MRGTSVTQYQVLLWWKIIPEPVAPVAYQVILEPGIGQFREFESPSGECMLV